MQPAAVTHAIEALDQRFEQHVGFLRARALACPPGGARPWDEALTHYQVSGDPAHVRVQSARDSGQRAGATVEEFRRAIEALARFAGDELERTLAGLGYDAGSAAQHRGSPDGALCAQRVEMFRARLRSAVEVEAERYGREVGAGEHKTVGASVSSVFANASATAKLTPWANVKVDPATVMTCWTCGAPQERPLDFKCRYCRNALYEKGK
jgi:hypothetical protein